jgi:hypothetical protein
MALIVLRSRCVHTFTLGLTFEFERTFFTRVVLMFYVTLIVSVKLVPGSSHYLLICSSWCV